MTVNYIFDVLLKLFLADIIIFGSLGLKVGDVSIRKVLTSILIGLFVFISVKNKLIKTWHVHLVVVLSLVFGIWAVGVPLANSVIMEHAISESLPLTGLLLILPISEAMKRNGSVRYLDFANFCLSVVSFVIISVWICATFLGKPEYAFKVKEFFSIISGEDFAIYIGPMADGSFRVMWIVCLLLPFIMMYKNRRGFDFGWSAFYLLAIYASGTRSLIYSSFLMVLILILRYRPLISGILIPSIFIGIVFYSQQLEFLRVFELRSEFNSDSVRVEQTLSLLRLFSENVFFGAGFGAQSDIVRSFDRPYSYEMTYVSLLAKVGLLGCFVFAWFFCSTLKDALRLFNGNKSEVVILFASFLFITGTNPYLLNFVGVTLIAMIVSLTITASCKY